MIIENLIQTLALAGFKANDQSQYALADGKGSAIYLYPDKNLVKVWEDLGATSCWTELALYDTNAIEILEKCYLTDKSIIPRIKELVPTSTERLLKLLPSPPNPSPNPEAHSAPDAQSEGV